MTKILHVDSSSRISTSITKQLSQLTLDLLKKAHPGATVQNIDLAVEPPPFVTEADINAVYTPEEHRSPEVQKIFAPIKKRVEDFVNADVYVFGVPMYNFGVPAAFKAFIDLVVIKGYTFEYAPDGLKPLLKNKKAYIISASGGNYESGPAKAMDHVEPYLRAVLGFIGITDITFVTVPGHSEEEIAASTVKAKAQIEAAVGLQAVSAGV